ncbi:hypothetical protein [Streptococcus sanguinis]|jgi:hypothetical protein|uniref:hypothetical protein n=1 Tax=Streptococcus sanguinis TaxID=1305 RepID=UPI0022E98264|nr:hypothetical protein [Streptococcus sanguinis]
MKYCVMFEKSLFNPYKSIERYPEVFQNIPYEIDVIDIVIELNTLEELDEFLNHFQGRATYDAKHKEICVYE